jgi:hypothetical protein
MLSWNHHHSSRHYNISLSEHCRSTLTPTHTYTHTHKYCDVRSIRLQDRPRFWIVISCSVCVTAWSSTLCTVPGREEGCPTGLPEALSAWDHWPRADGGAAKEKWEGRDGSSKILLHLEDAEIMDQLFFLPLSSVLKGGNNDSTLAPRLL